MAKLNISSSVTPTMENKIPVSMKEAAKKKLEELMKEEMELVSGIFQFFEVPGGSTEICVKKYPGQMFRKVMVDQLIYKIPKYVARHLNGVDITAGALVDPNQRRSTQIGTCGYEVHQSKALPSGELRHGEINGAGIHIPVTEKKVVRRFGFNYLENSGLSE